MEKMSSFLLDVTSTPPTTKTSMKRCHDLVECSEEAMPELMVSITESRRSKKAKTSDDDQISSITSVADDDHGHSLVRTVTYAPPPQVVSTELTLFDKTWNCNHNYSSVGDDVVCREQAGATNLAWTRHYHEKDLEEEKLRGVSTQLNLYDPWKIKKKLTVSDTKDSSLCRLIVGKDLVNHHILPYLKGLESEKVVVYDLDTRTEHELCFKQWRTSGSYIFNNGWSKYFSKRRDLKVGEEIGLYWNPCNSRFDFSILSRKSCLAPLKG